MKQYPMRILDRKKSGKIREVFRPTIAKDDADDQDDNSRQASPRRAENRRRQAQDEEVIDRGGSGHEIVRELRVCPDCIASRRV